MRVTFGLLKVSKTPIAASEEAARQQFQAPSAYLFQMSRTDIRRDPVTGDFVAGPAETIYALATGRDVRELRRVAEVRPDVLTILRKRGKPARSVYQSAQVRQASDLVALLKRLGASRN